MQAQVRTIVAASGERLVVMPEAQYAALVNAAGQQSGSGQSVTSRAGQAMSPAQMMAAMPSANTPRPAVRRMAPKAPAKAVLTPVADAAAPAAAPADAPRKCSLEDVLLFG